LYRNTTAAWERLCRGPARLWYTTARLQSPNSTVSAHPTSLWPTRITSLSRGLADSTGPRREALLAEIWVLLHSAVSHYAHLHESRMTRLDPDDHADLVSAKASDLVRRIDTGAWRPHDHAPAQVAAFASTAARNGLVDEIRRRKRLTRAQFDEISRGDQEVVTLHRPDPQALPDERFESLEYGEALVDCLLGLKDRTRTILFFRLFYDMPTKIIASHPEIGSSVNSVDVILLRARQRLTKCMAGKGFDTTEIPAGTFGVVWRSLRMGVLAASRKQAHG
jgi:RNA polymerase sigma factor (sigma-70 family)